MENQLRELILPLADDLINQLNNSIEKQGKSKINFYWIELTVWIMIAAFAVKIMAGLIKLLFAGGYQGSYLDCKSCGKKAKFHRYSPRRDGLQ
ncbi:MAG TPA: hypothetical protein VNN73_13155 [Blastocatellia bacterium]|nr:hypothetical protein [Blastocatellia bacterium]